MKRIITSGYFNPIHSGHISYLNEASKLGDKLIVIVNNDKQIELKGSKPFMDNSERLNIVSNLKAVDEVHISQSSDKSVCKDLELLREKYSNDELIFAKGGDRDEKDAANPNSPLYYDIRVCKKNNIAVTYNVGCKKVISSSEILKNVK
jgi:cytidyltransferase-like protein